MKHLLLIPAALLVSAISLAQLYVAPNENGTPVDPLDDTDSFIYVNDQILFVENDINLTENTEDPTTKASIYLRNGSQLIQGESNGANAGSGYISTYRLVPDSDAWDYTFYGSPVGDIFTTPAAGAGNINFGANSLSSVVGLTESKPAALTASRQGFTDIATDSLTISHRWLYTRAAGSGATWIRMFRSNAAPAGQGFIMKGVNQDDMPGNADQVYDFRGRPNNGTFTFNTITPVMPRTTEQVLTGNPYPSALDLNRLFYDTRTGDPDGAVNLQNTEINAILFWDENRDINSHFYIDNKGGFGTWVPGTSNPDGTNAGTYVVAPFLNYRSNGTPIPPDGSEDPGMAYERRFAPVGQGFYFRTIPPLEDGMGMIIDLSPDQVFIKNQYRKFVKEGAANFSEFRSASNPTDTDVALVDNRDPQVRIYTYFGESHFRDMVLAFSDYSTDYYDWGMDAIHPMDATFAEAYFPVQKYAGQDESLDEFVIQTVPWEVEKRIPYAILLDEQTEVVVQVVEAVKITNPVLLYDSTLNTYTHISGNSTATLNLPAGEYKDRFFIVFKGSASDPTTFVPDSQRAQIIEEVTGNVDFFQNNRAAQLEIMNPEAYTLKYAHIFDMTGKLVTTRTDLGKNTNYSISTATMADGMYLVKLVTSDNVSIDYKAIVTNK